jgi:hypothetical protein
LSKYGGSFFFLKVIILKKTRFTRYLGAVVGDLEPLPQAVRCGGLTWDGKANRNWNGSNLDI